MRRLAILILLCTSAIHAQGTASHLRTQASNPTSCRPGDVNGVVSSGVATPYYCTSSAVWTVINLGGNTGIVQLNGLNAGIQTFANDTNVIITSAGSTHTLGWSGTLSVSRGGTGVGTFTGVAKGNGTSAFTAAAFVDITSLWTSGGTCSATTFLRGDGQCQTPTGSGNVSNVATPTNGQIAQWTSATSIQGLGTTGSGNVVLATSPTLVTPNLGTPSAATLTNATGLPLSGLSGTTAYSVLSSGTTNPSWITPTANGQCLLSDASSYTTTTPSFRTCPGGVTGITGGNPVTATNPMTFQSAATFANGSPWVDVTAPTYGADPTGVADSLAAVEAAMTAACAVTPSGAVVFFPPGKYTFSAPIPNTSTLWCNGEVIKGSGIRVTELDFPTGTGFAINEKSGTSLSNDLRNLTISDFLLVVGGGSGGSNNGLGGIFIGNYAFTHTYKNLYIIGPTTSTAHGISTTGDAYVSTIDLYNFRVDNFQGSNGTAFYFEVSGTGDLLRCTFCYASSPNIGIDVGFFWTAVLESSDVDGSNNIGFYLHPANGNTIIGDGLSGEGNTHDLYRIYGNGGATVGGTVILTNPKSTGQLSATSAFYPIDITNFAGDVTIVNPVTQATGGSAVASLNISNTPHAVTIVGCDQLLDKGFSTSANTYLSQSQGNLCSNTQGSLSVIALTQPTAPTVTPTCTGTCASTWSYKVVALDAVANPTQASAAGSTAANATTLTSSNFNTITWPTVAGARYYNVYRTVSGGTPANLSLLCSNVNQSVGLTCKDDGSVNTGSVTPSAVNLTGSLTAGSIGTGASPPNCGTSTGTICLAEAGTAGTPTTGLDYIRADTSHNLKFSINGGAEANLLAGAQYSKIRCEPGLGDGLNSMAAGTYLQSTCYNDSGVTWTITGVRCFTDNNGSSTLAVAGNTLGSIAASFTCSSSWPAAGSLVGTALTSGDRINFTFVADGTSKQTTWVVSMTQ